MQRLASLSPALARQPANGRGTQAFSFYEAQQPPLYYWIAATVMRSESTRPIADRVFRMRLLSVLLTSFAIPFTFLAARAAFGKRGDVGDAILCAALSPSRPASPSIARELRMMGSPSVSRPFSLDGHPGENALGVDRAGAWGGYSCKAYLLILMPVLLIARFRKPGFGKTWRQTLYALALGVAIGGWWYVRNLAMGLPLTGWILSAPLGALTVSAAHLSWITAGQTIAKSFTWFGAWSFMTLRSWMYTALEAAAIAGMLAGIARRNANLLAPYAFTVLCALAMVWGAAAYNATQAIPGIPGWYLWPAGGAMAILIVAGLGRFAIAFALMLAAADLFGVAARMMPFYAGLAPWNHGSVTQFVAAAAPAYTFIVRSRMDRSHSGYSHGYDSTGDVSGPGENPNIVHVQYRWQFRLVICGATDLQKDGQKHRLVRNAIERMEPLHTIDNPHNLIGVPLHDCGVETRREIANFVRAAIVPLRAGIRPTVGEQRYFWRASHGIHHVDCGRFREWNGQ